MKFEVGVAINPADKKPHILVNNIFVGPALFMMPDGHFVKAWLRESIEDLAELIDRLKEDEEEL